MRWMVGVDLRNTSAGAVAFARSLAKRVPGHTFVGTHVVEDHVLAAAAELGLAAGEDLPAYVQSVLSPLAESDAFAEVGSLAASAAEDGLRTSATKHNCGALIIGRVGPRQGGGLVRLGRVARRLLRELPLPLVVVPPDMDEADFGDGPVLLAADPSTEGHEASAFAKTMARALDVDILVTAVVPHHDDYVRFLPSDAWATSRETSVRGTHEDLKRWIKARDLGEVRSSVVDGSVVPALIDVAKVSGASMIVVGSRRLSLVDRMFSSSVGSALAAQAPIPVAVVPPP